jgi:hypothetical protein
MTTSTPLYTLIHISKEITTIVKPKAIVVFSAHWQSSREGKLQINSAEHTDIIYDFYGFPEHYYKYAFPNKGSPSLAAEVAGRLEEAGIKVETVERGLDHGVWSGFVVGTFAIVTSTADCQSDLSPSCSAVINPDTNPLDVPIVRVLSPATRTRICTFTLAMLYVL